MQALQHPLQHHARLQLAGAAVGVLHRQQQLGVAFGIARAGAQRAGHRQAQAVRLARPLPQPAFFNHSAVQIQGVDRQRKVAAFLQPKGFGDRQSLAAQLAVQIVQINIQLFGLRIALQVVFQLFVEGARWRSGQLRQQRIEADDIRMHGALQNGDRSRPEAGINAWDNSLVRP